MAQTSFASAVARKYMRSRCDGWLRFVPNASPPAASGHFSVDAVLKRGDAYTVVRIPATADATPRLCHELRQLRNLSAEPWHANVVRLVEALDVGGTTCLHLAPVYSASLALCVEKWAATWAGQSLEAHFVCRLVTDVSAGLAFLHRERHLVHRQLDWHAINVGIVRRQQVTFVVDRLASAAPVDGVVVGPPAGMTPHHLHNFASPEMRAAVAGESLAISWPGVAITPKTDVYSLGAVVCHVVRRIWTGRPFCLPLCGGDKVRDNFVAFVRAELMAHRMVDRPEAGRIARNTNVLALVN